MPIIYADILIAINWLIDDLILSATACVLRLTTTRRRLLLAGLLGGISGLIVLLPPQSVTVSLLIKLLCACVLTAVAFPWYGFRSFLKTTVVFFSIAAMFAGILSGIWLHTSGETFLVRNGMVYFSVSPLWLALFAGVSYGAVRVYNRFTRKNAPSNCEYTLVIEHGGKRCSCRALYDTGLHLNEPFSGKPVLVVEREVVFEVADEPLQEALLLRQTVGAGYCNVRIIPYRALGNNGLLPAFMPKSITVHAAGKPPRDMSGAYVAVAENLGRGEFRALIGSGFL